MINKSVAAFDKKWKSYDQWYDKHPEIYQSELAALQKLVPSGKGLEVGVGTGRFASVFSVDVGLDPSINMLRLAQKRGLAVVKGVGETLPFKNDSFHFVMIVVTLCFTDNPQLVLTEAKRVLKKKGEVILAIIDRTGSWGQYYRARSTSRSLYHTARFLLPEDILQMFTQINMEYAEAYQTLTHPPPVFHQIEKPRKGYGKAGFAVFKARKP